MSKERLEEIKDKVSLLRNSSELQPLMCFIMSILLDWLIEQAEENLEFDRAIEDLQTQRNSAVERVKELEQQNKRYRNLLESLSVTDDIAEEIFKERPDKGLVNPNDLLQYILRKINDELESVS